MMMAIAWKVLTAISMRHLPWLLLGCGTLLLTGTLFYFMMSRRGETKSITKCVLLSLWAHLILVGCAYLTNWFPVTAGHPQGDGELIVQWLDTDADGDDDMPDGLPADEWAADATHTALLANLPTPDRHFLTSIEAVTTVDEAERPAVTDVADVPDEAGESARPEKVEAQLVAEDAPAATRSLGPALSTSSTTAEPAAPAADAATPSPPAEPIEPDADAEYVFSSTAAPHSLAADVTAAPPREMAVAEPATRPAAGPPVSLAPVSDEAPSLPPRYQGRTADKRRQLAAARGGSAATEAAVDAALRWLAQAQNPHDGRWDNRAWEGGWETRELDGQRYGIQADTAVTGLALLAFLGAGHTQQQGEYAGQVQLGLEFLLRSQATQTGSLAGNASPYVAMYCHGIATLAVSEALIMTGDPRLRRCLQRAVDYTIRCQHPVTGGWRYQPGGLGDTSQFGWQVMALVSAQSAGIAIPDSTWHAANRWLSRVSLGTAGGLACYTPDRPLASPSMTAEAMFCRPFLPGLPRQAAVDEAADFVARYGMRDEALQDLYFSYYATLALYPLQDERWRRWNQTLTGHLVAKQQKSGSLAGSWSPDTKWGPTGGRVYSTSMACLCLETYYRYLPVYELAAARGRAVRQR